MKLRTIQSLLLASALVIAASYGADEKQAQPASVKLRISGLYCADRQQDLCDVAAQMKDIALAEFDYDKSEATFTYNSSKILKNARPEQILQHVDGQLRNVSHGTFGVLALSTIPREKLQKVEIDVAVLDCKACGLGLYWAVSRIPGVEQTFTDYKTGHIVAWLDSDKVDRAKIVSTLKQREIIVREPESQNAGKK